MLKENMSLLSLHPEVILHNLTYHSNLLKDAEVAHLGPLQLRQRPLQLQGLPEEASLQKFPLHLHELQLQLLLHLQSGKS